jgi:hypothetical protein
MGQLLMHNIRYPRKTTPLFLNRLACNGFRLTASADNPTGALRVSPLAGGWRRDLRVYGLADGGVDDLIHAILTQKSARVCIGV